jgi:hypothetical protein
MVQHTKNAGPAENTRMHQIVGIPEARVQIQATDKVQKKHAKSTAKAQEPTSKLSFVCLAKKRAFITLSTAKQTSATNTKVVPTIWSNLNEMTRMHLEGNTGALQLHLQM